MRVLAVTAFFLVAVGLVAALPPPEAPEPLRTVVVANARDADSVALARHYLAARGIPEGNLLALPMPDTEEIAWPVFVAEVLNPLQATLLARGWLDGMLSAVTDDAGRQRAVVTGHRIAYLVLVRGVPLKISHRPEWVPATPPAGANPALLVNQASVDAELALLPSPGSPLLGLVPNPLFRVTAPNALQRDRVVRVARLDGPTPGAVRALIDGAVAAEARGLAGRAYLDLGGPHAQGNEWLERAAQTLDELGFETDVDRAPETLRPWARFDAPAIYLGWYDWNLSGPAAEPGFRFPAGAVAVHIHSFSAATLRSDAAHWCGPVVARGAAATLGNVYEPYLQATHHLDVFVAALAEGRTFGEAAYRALPALSWQAVAVGDPLYRPFAVGIDEQWRRRAEFPEELRPAVAARQARHALRAGQGDAAVLAARQAFQDQPGLGTGLTLARTVREVQGAAAALQQLGFLDVLPSLPARDCPVVPQLAALLLELGAGERAVALYGKRLVDPPADRSRLLALLGEAIATARAAGLAGSAAQWEIQRQSLEAEAAAEKKS